MLEINYSIKKFNRWGCDHEKMAVALYNSVQSSIHQDFASRECGLFVWKSHPYMGASPDAMVSCSCCGDGCIEIKCPHCLTKKSVDAAVESQSSFCLEKDNQGNFTLKRDHQYYYQVLSQVTITCTVDCGVV